MELGFALAQLVEWTEARNVAAWAAEHIEVGGGIASFAGPTSPISHAIGMGMHGAVAEADLERLEEFYRARGASASLDLCPLADASLMEQVGRRGYRITEFNNVLVRTLPGEAAALRDVRVVSKDEAEVWIRTLTGGFFERDNLTDEELAIGAGIFSMPGAAAFLAEADGEAAAAAAACANGSVLYLFGDATLPRFRRRSMHAALIHARLEWGGVRGCTLAAACTVPGSGSQRNYERAGFAVAYTKMNMARDWA